MRDHLAQKGVENAWRCRHNSKMVWVVAAAVVVGGWVEDWDEVGNLEILELVGLVL